MLITSAIRHRMQLWIDRWSTAATVEEVSQGARRQVPALVRADSASLNEVDLEQQPLILVSKPVDVRYPDDAPATSARLVAQHPLTGHHVHTGDGPAHKSATSAEPT